MESFEYYIAKKEVVKQTPNLERAKSLIEDGFSRFKDAKSLDLEKFPKIVFENVYDALRDFCDAILIVDGWKSYSHEASISYLTKKGFDIASVLELDRFRYKRNGSKYYGERVSISEARNIKAYFLKIIVKLDKFISDIK